jgi:hypothetical protein
MLDPLFFKDGSEWKPDWRYELYLRETYINLGTEWQRMITWMKSNPSKCPAKDMKRFVGNWMNKSGVIRTKTTQPSMQELPKPNLDVAQNWMQKIRNVLKGREPGQDESEAA